MKFIRSEQLRLPWWVWTAIALFPLLVGVRAAAGVIVTKPQADSLYVRRDTFALYRIEQHGTQAWRDSVLAQLQRACQHRGECP